MNAAPVKAPAFGLVSVKVSVVLPVTAIFLGAANALLKVGAVTTNNVAAAAVPVSANGPVAAGAPVVLVLVLVAVTLCVMVQVPPGARVPPLKPTLVPALAPPVRVALLPPVQLTLPAALLTRVPV